MSFTSLPMSAGTWITQDVSSQHGTDTLLRCGRRYNNEANSYAVLQWTIPNTIKYKRITFAQIKYYSQWYYYGSPANYQGQNGMEVAPYVLEQGQDIASLTGVNYVYRGTLGEWVTVEPFANNWGEPYPKWRTADVTGIINGNINADSLFTVFMAGYPGYGNRAADLTSATCIEGNGTLHVASLDIIYEDVVQQPPTPSYPVGANVKENEELLFSWAWNSSTEAVQASVQIDYKLKTADTWTTVNLTQTSHTYRIAAGLPQGTYQWRIKGTNDAGETSDFSGIVEFTVVGKPPVPVINAVPNKAVTEITWNAVEQLSADVSLKDADGNIVEEKTIASSEAVYKPNVFLKGNYSVAVRIKNAAGLISDWAYKAFSITAAGPTKPTMRLMRDDVQVKITLTTQAGIQYAVIRKEDVQGAPEKLLGYANEGTFTDKTFALGTVYRYVVRAYSTGGYTDSDPERAICHKDAVILETADDEVILDKSEESFLPYSEDSQRDYSVFKAVGRKYPIVEHGEQENWTFKSNLYVREDQKERIKAMAMKNKIYYRDYSGRAFPVAIEMLSFNRYMNDGYIADIQFLRISEEEVIINV